MLNTLPIEPIELAIGGQTWVIHAVRDQAALLAASSQLAQMPFGLLLWESAIGLAQWLAEEQAMLPGKRILELGAGVGLPGLVAAYYGADVWQSDHDPFSLDLAARNANQNRTDTLVGTGQLHTFQADWRTWQRQEQYDLIIAADILYERELYPFLHTIFEKNLLPGGKLMLTDPGRPQAFDCMTALEQAGWHVSLQIEQVHAVAISRWEVKR